VGESEREWEGGKEREGRRWRDEGANADGETDLFFLAE
jgi:hypothetical protein